MELHSPWPGPTTVTRLPNPDLANARRLGSSMRLKRSMTGSIVTHIKKRTVSKVHKFQFTLTRYKALEVLEFMRIHLGVTMKLLWGVEVLIGVIKTNPTEIALTQRAIVADSVEATSFSFEFETVQ